MINTTSMNHSLFEYVNTGISYIGKPVFLKNEIDLGIGRIEKYEDEKFTIRFADDTIRKRSISGSTIVFLPDPQALNRLELMPGELGLSLKSLELKYTHIYDKLSSLSNSRTRLLPHQIESTFVVVNSLKPRFILADEVGLGKTIEAGLIMKELMFRKGYKNVLVVSPSPLVMQWKSELKNKFNEDFQVVKRSNFINKNQLHWNKFNKLITSLDFIKNPIYTEEILKRKWDIVIFDEAHRLRRDYSKVTRGYLFAEKISKKTECLLLLSATPFRGKLEELYFLLYLVDPNILGSYHAFVNDYVLGSKSDLKEKLGKVLLRRRKVEIGGFTKRFAKTVMIELSGEERAFYDETTSYVREEYNLAMQTKNRAIGFVMVVFQKLLDSSVHALLNALSKRKFLLENRIQRLYHNQSSVKDWDPEETEDLDESFHGLDDSTRNDFAGLKKEIFTLNRLVHLGKKIPFDSKAVKLKEILLKLRKLGHEKFIIFTQFRSTQDYLFSILKDEFEVTLFHGSLSLEEKEIAIQTFKEKSQVLISTEAGGEGRNLQFSNVLFNYDLPWSPLKIEQRIGRIHRFGQKKDVYIFNFACKDTVAERVLEVLSEKIRLFEESIGASDALLGNIEAELDFRSTFMKFVTLGKTKKEIEEEMDLRIRVAENGFRRLDSLVTPKLLDFNLQDYYNHTLKERQFDNTHLEEFVLGFLQSFPEAAGFQLTKLSENRYRYKTSSETKEATFDSEIALRDDSLEFLAFGHPMIERVVNYFSESGSGFGAKYFRLRGFKNKIFYVYLVDYSFSLSRSEILYYVFDKNSLEVEKLDSIPQEIKDFTDFVYNRSSEQFVLETGFIHTYRVCESDAESRRNALEKETRDLFQKEEFKLELSSQKSLRMLKEKLDRQEAQSLWSKVGDNRSAISRTKNEIQKKQEEYERELRKIKNGSKITKSVSLFQIYIGI